MGNVSLPTPVLVAGGAVCQVGGYLIGSVTQPDTPQRTTAVVVSFDGTSTLCLGGEAVKDEQSVDAAGVLCGTWSHAADATLPKKGDDFRFVSMDTPRSGSSPARTALYGAVVK